MSTLSNKVYIESAHKNLYHQLILEAGLENLTLTADKAEANILLADPPLVATQLDEFTNLTWLQSTFAGVDTLMAEGIRQDYQLTNIRRKFGQLISEYVIGYTLSYFRHFALYAQQQQDKVWQPHNYESISGKKMLILGTGSIGRQLASCAHGLGFEVLGMNQTGHIEALHQFSHLYSKDELHQALTQADIIVNTLPKTPQTTDLLDEAAFMQCHDALLFNVGRGDAIVPAALLDALEKGHIKHAFLDVFKQEPISQSCPYWHHPQVTVTPHIAATSFANDVFEIFRQNYQAFNQGRGLDNLVDFEKGY